MKEIKSLKFQETEEARSRSVADFAMKNPGMKLPKFNLKSFEGDPLKWRSFIETFHAAVDSQDNITDIEKFTYLKGQLEGPAADCISGFSLTSQNYQEAKQLLEERFGNQQLIISSHMNELLKLPKLKEDDNVQKLTFFYNTIESSIRSLMAMGLDSSNYGPLLIPIILERLPDSIRLIVTRALGRHNWQLSEFINCITGEVDARGNCVLPLDKKDQYQDRFTTQTLVGTKKTSRRQCTFCGKAHYNDKCLNVTDVAIRKKILRDEKR